VPQIINLVEVFPAIHHCLWHGGRICAPPLPLRRHQTWLLTYTFSWCDHRVMKTEMVAICMYTRYSPADAGAEVSEKNGYKKSMAYKKVFAMQKQWVVEVVKRINAWAKIEWDANEMISKNPCTTDLTNQWTNESINQWTNEPVGRWINEPKNQWSNEPVIQWVNDSVNRCTNQWTDDSADP